uniref:PDZ domain-containing protein n=1 Tax=Hyaloperonospora arabidopsidis (strain Emoy2) TaxID=559515 RepID=M4BBW1_HYAAE
MSDVADALLPPTPADLAVQLDERKMYVVEWVDGAVFGFTVTPVQSDRGPVLCLVRRTATDASVGLQDVVPGDLLIAIGPEKVYHLGPTKATTLLRAVAKPVRLTLQLSPYGAGATAAADLPDLAPNEYTYLWTSGPLGIVLTTDVVSKLPRVKRFTGKADSTALERDVKIGDELLYVNQTPTRDHSVSAIIQIIREMPKPITLRFRKPLTDELQTQLPELAEGEYDFLWEYGSLGLVVGTSADGLPYVRSFTGKGTSKQLTQVQENDEIVMVNDRLAKEYGFHETMQYIMNVPKPALIRFRRPFGYSSKTDMLDQFTKSSMPLTTQMAAMSVTGDQPQLQRTSSAVLPACAASSPVAFAPVRSHSSSHCSPAASETETGSGILGYRSARSNSSLPIVRRQNSAKSQGQTLLPGQAAEDLTFGQMASGQGYGDNAYRHQSAPVPPQQVYHQQVPLQQQQSFYKSQQQTPQEARNGGHVEEGEFFEIDSNAYYQIQWTDGPFGFTVREAQSEQGSIVLITKRTGKSTCAGLRRVAVGDILIKIGNKDVRQLGFERSTMHLRNVPKPVLLTFQAID